MDTINIRKAVSTDIPYLYEICLKTGNTGKDASDHFYDPYLIGSYNVAPYVFFPDGICFVAECQYRPQGYIAAVPDTIAFRQWMDENWLPQLREQLKQPFPKELIRSEKENWIINRVHKKGFLTTADQPWLIEYPAHLHINLLPNIQRKGIGRKLIDKLFSILNKKCATGIHFNVDLANTGAVDFYKKLGFSIIKDHEWYLTMGKYL